MTYCSFKQRDLLTYTTCLLYLFGVRDVWGYGHGWAIWPFYNMTTFHRVLATSAHQCVWVTVLIFLNKRCGSGLMQARYLHPIADDRRFDPLTLVKWNVISQHSLLQECFIV